MPLTKRFVALALACLGTALPATAHGPTHGVVPKIARSLALNVTGISAAETVTPLATCSRGSEPDVADTTTLNRTQIIYFVPAGKTDECLDSLQLINSMNSLNAFFVTQTLGALRIDRTSTGAMDIPFVRGQKNQDGYSGVGDIATELKNRGYDKPGKRYIIFAADDEGGICGEAEYPGRYAAFFLDSDSGCGTRSFGNGTLEGAGAAEVVSGQEILHNDGIVDLLAPNGCQVSLLHYGHVCTPGGILAELGNLDPESRDIMFPYVTGLRLSQKVLDRNRDDYFKVAAPWAFLITDLNRSPYFE